MSRTYGQFAPSAGHAVSERAAPAICARRPHGRADTPELALSSPVRHNASEFSVHVGGLHSATKRRFGRRRQMCRIRAHLQWDDRLDAIPPLAGSLLALISLFIVLTIVAR
jgi:hypothetical protein